MNHFLRQFSVLCLLSAASARAAEPAVSPVERPTDLGHGLAYLRVESLAASATPLASAAPGPKALVLDLRQVTASDEAVENLRAALAGRTATAAPLFILVSPATPEAVARIIAQSPSPLLTLGVAGSLPAPKVIVHADAETDRRAYDALATGTTIDALIFGKIAKDRYDEASLVQKFKNGNHDAEPPPPPDPTLPKPNAATEKTATPSLPTTPTPDRVGPDGLKVEPRPVEPLVDRVLQRAVHLHRALLALRPR